MATTATTTMTTTTTSTVTGTTTTITTTTTTKQSTNVLHESETLYVNGQQVRLGQSDEAELKRCLLNGLVPEQWLLDKLLTQVGLLKPNGTTRVRSAEFKVSQSQETHCLVTANSDRAANWTSTEKSTVVGNDSTSVRDNSTVLDDETTSFLSPLKQPLRDDRVIFTLLSWKDTLRVNTEAVLEQILKWSKNGDSNDEAMKAFLLKWMEWFPHDFENAQLLRLVKQKCEPKIVQTLTGFLNAVKRHRRKHCSKTSSEQQLSPANIPLEASSEAVAQELTRLELEHLQFLNPSDVLQLVVKGNVVQRSRSSSASSNHSDISLASASTTTTMSSVLGESEESKISDVEIYVQWFNKLARIVASSICLSRKKRDRCRALDHWIETARHCVNIGNFNSLMAIISGLSLNPVSRLKKTWSKMHSGGKFTALEHQLDPSSNFSCYRSTLSAALSRSEEATSQLQRIAIPFFSVYLKDLITLIEQLRLNDPNSCSIKDFDLKSAMVVADRLREYNERKRDCCPFEKQANIEKLILYSSALTDEELEVESYACETPNNSLERDVLKAALKFNYVLLNEWQPTAPNVKNTDIRIDRFSESVCYLAPPTSPPITDRDHQGLQPLCIMKLDTNLCCQNSCSCKLCNV